MSEEKALKIFARCYNERNFAPLVRRLHRKASYGAYNRIYVSRGRPAVSRALAEKAAALQAQPRPSRAYMGFLIKPRDVGGIKAEYCVVLTRDDPRQAEGVVRIRCTPLHIKDIWVYDPAQCQYTRGSYIGPEG
jgi:hypothetical protein